MSTEGIEQGFIQNKEGKQIMCEIKDFFIDHPGISVRFVEKELGIPSGTIRLTSSRPIPARYHFRLKVYLKQYGLSKLFPPRADSTFIMIEGKARLIDMNMVLDTTLLDTIKDGVVFTISGDKPIVKPFI